VTYPAASVSANRDAADQVPDLLEAVALLVERPENGIGRGSVGTVVDMLDGEHVLVEFADDQGRAYAITPCPTNELLVLRFVPVAA
jgi:Domain of unknown function (DUF4926)